MPGPSGDQPHANGFKKIGKMNEELRKRKEKIRYYGVGLGEPSGAGARKMEHEGTRASSAQGTSPPSPASPPTTTAATTPEAGQRREKKRPPKSSSSQFFTLLSHGATHVQKLVGVEGSAAGGVHHPSLEESHLLGSTHLDDDEHDQVLDATATLNSATGT
jgi:hypothetical protein